MTRKSFEAAEESILYRTPMQVKEILVAKGKMFDYNVKHTFPICPRCGVPMEYEYQKYCNCCGQRLSWAHYGKAKFRYPGEKRNKLPGGNV